MFSPSNERIVFVSTDCPIVKMMFCLNPNFALNLFADIVIQSIITLIANFLSIKILLNCFFSLSTSSYMCFL